MLQQPFTNQCGVNFYKFFLGGWSCFWFNTVQLSIAMGGFGLAVQVDRPDHDLVKLLLQNGADPGFRFYRNMNALELAAKKGLKDVAGILRSTKHEQNPTVNPYLPIPRSPGRKPGVRVPITVLPDHAIPRRTLNNESFYGNEAESTE